MVNVSIGMSSADLHALDTVVRKKKFLNRSDAMRDYIRRGLREDLGSERNEEEQAQHICDCVATN